MNWLKHIFARRRIRGDLSQEIRAHLEEKVEELVAAGVPREEAEHAARRQFGNVLLTEQTAREVWSWPALENFWMDVCYGLRTRRGWLMAGEVVLLGVGIVAAFLSLSAARASLSTVLRVPHPNRTYFLGQGSGQIPQANYAELASWRERRDVFSHVGAFSEWGPVVVETQSRSVDVEAAWVAKGMTQFLPPRMDLGRPLLGSDFFPGSKNVLITERLVRELGLRSPVGSLIQSDWGAFHVVGVLPGWARFPYPSQPDLIIPTIPNQQDASSYTVLAELRARLPWEAAEEALNPSSQTSGVLVPWQVHLISMKASLDPGTVRISEYGLALGLVTLFLLIATASLIELLDAIRGKKERSIKLALGATQARLALERTLGVFVICVLATAVGGLFVAAGWPWLARAWGTDWVTVPRLDGFTLASLGALLLFACLAVSVAPVVIARATRAYAALKEERASTSLNVQRTRMAIISLQVAVSIAFGFGAARLAAGLHALATEPLGMNIGNVWDGTLQYAWGRPGVPSLVGPGTDLAALVPRFRLARQQSAPALRKLLRLKLQSLPGVAGVALANEGPAISESKPVTRIAPRGEPENSVSGVPVTAADPDYLQLLGSRLAAGRYFTPADASVPVGKGNPVILSEPLARRLFRDVSPVGKEIDYITAFGLPSGGFCKVVGVVSGMRTFGLQAPVAAEMFEPLDDAAGILALRMKGSAVISLTEVQGVVSDVFPGARVEGFEPLRARFDTELAVPRQRLGLLAFFATISAAVAVFGLASVLLVIIKERDLEFGIRRALGATDRDLATALLKQVLPWVALGLAAGLLFPILFPAPLGVGVASGRRAAVWPGAVALSAMLVLIAASLWLPLRRAFRRPVSDLLRAE